MNQGAVGDLADFQRFDIAARAVHGAQQVLGVQNADDVVRIALEHRQPGIGAGQHLFHDLRRRLVGIDHRYAGSVGHDFVDLQVAEIQNARQHLPLGIDLRIRLRRRVQPDHPTQFFLAGSRRKVAVEPHAEHPEGAFDDKLDRPGGRPQHNHDGAQQRRDAQGGAVGVIDGVGLRHHLGEDQHHEGHDNRGVEHAVGAEPADEQAGGQRRRQDVRQVVAEQDGADQPVGPRPQPVHDAGGSDLLVLEFQHPGLRGRRHRRFRSGKEGGEHHQQENREDREKDFHGSQQGAGRRGRSGNLRSRAGRIGQPKAFER